MQTDEPAPAVANDPSWEAVFRHARSGIAVTEPGSRRIAFANESFARMHGYRTSDLPGLTLGALTVEERTAPTTDPASSDGPRVYRSVHRRRDGSRFPVEVEEVTVRDRSQAPFSVVQVRDITEVVAGEEERRRFEEQVRHTQKLESLGVLAGGIAHDFNNLLMGILANTELALHLLPSDASCRHHLSQVRETALRAGELANQMLAYSGRGHFQIRPLDVNEVVREIGDLLRVSLSKKVVLRHGFQPDLPPIDGDPVQIRQVIMNLITNASDAIGDETGVITVTTGCISIDRTFLPDVADNAGEGDYVFVEVRDTGAGMSPETKSKIFEPFFTTKLTGRGLGLAAVFGILRGHRGTIRVHSVPDEGTSFCVFFPRAQGGAANDAGSLRPAGRLSATILVAEDEDRVRRGLCEMLELAGCRVIEARDGREALKLFDKHAGEISALLLDLTMPELSGRQVFAELQRREAGVPVVVMSGYAEGELDQGFTGNARVEFLQKPIPMARLLNALRSVLGGDGREGERND